MKVLFLYTELAEYFVKCCEALSKISEVHIIRWPVNKEAPFRFTFPNALKVYDKKDFPADKLQALVTSIKPDLVVCSGWIDKDYLRVCRLLHQKIPTVIALDTKWIASVKQYVASIAGKLVLKRIFSHAWVPGQAQYRYAEKLGFKAERIRTGFYCCDLEKFNAIYATNAEAKKSKFPRRFIFAGRYYDFKGVPELWQAFVELRDESGTDWELWCMGAGSLEPVQHEGIRHLGFVQPEDFRQIAGECGVFILPSRFEPWAVAVQEFAAAGFPLILSDAVGAGEAFLEENANGYCFLAGDKQDLRMQLKKVIHLSNEELNAMAGKSHQLAQKITPENWVNTVKSFHL